VHSFPSNAIPKTAKKYTEDHELVAFDDETGVGIVTVTDYAQSSLGDVVFIELPSVGTEVKQGGKFKNGDDRCGPG
jgi:glycine cleavage system H protein